MNSRDKFNVLGKLNEVLKGEHSAAEIYQQVLETIGEETQAAELRRILVEHEEAISTISETIEAMGGEPRNDSGVWGGWARTITGAATFIGERASLKALKEGEEHGLKQYEALVDEDNMSLEPRVENLIAIKYIPQQQAHIATIDRLMDQIAS